MLLLVLSSACSESPILPVTDGFDPDPGPQPAVLVGAGDIAGCGSANDDATAALLDNIEGTVFTAGDNAYPNGTVQEYLSCYHHSWGRHRARTRPAAGNHEYNTANAAGYYDYFGTAAGDRDKGYYSYDIESWHVVVLNSNIAHGPGSAQDRWLRDDLASSPARCTIAYWHHPRFSSSSEHGNDPSVQPFWEALYEADAELVIVGHDHTYERFAPQTPTGQPDPARGIRQFVVGTGGRSHYGFGRIQPNSEVRNGTAYGVIRVDLFADSYAWEFVPVAGATFTDSGSGSCH
jgi:hypothetical protein